jgi:hypothetical protein
MIAGALVYRNHRDTKAAVSKLRIVCSPELAAACDAVAGQATTVVEPETATYDRLVKADTSDPGIDAWVTIGLLPQMADDQRSSVSEHLVKGGASLGTSRIGMAVFNDRLAALTAFCKGTLTWQCVGDAAAKQVWKAAGGQEAWGDIKYAMDDPTATASGLAELGGLATGYLKQNGAIPSQNDDSGQALQDWLQPIAKARRPEATLAVMAAGGPAVADAAVVVEALAGPSVGGSRGLTLVYPQPVQPIVDAQVAEYGHGNEIEEQLVPAMRDALRKAGWGATVDTFFPHSPGLINLRAMWREVSR